MRLSMVAATLCCSNFAAARLLEARQGSAASTSASTISSSSSSSAAVASSSSSAAVSLSSSADLGISVSFTSATAASSGSSLSTGATDSASPTSAPNSTFQCTAERAQMLHTQDNYTGPVSLCGIEGGVTRVFLGDQRRILWWGGAFPNPNAKVAIMLKSNGSLGFIDQDIPASKGFSVLTVNSTMMNSSSQAIWTLFLEESETGGTPVEVVGPQITLLTPNNTPQASPPTHFNLLGVAIGLPLALAVVVGVLLVFCCMTKKYKSVFSKIRLPTRRRGYGVRQSRRQRTGNAVDEFDFDASAPIYRDDPGEDYAASTRDERSARAMGVFSAERKLHSTY